MDAAIVVSAIAAAIALFALAHSIRAAWHERRDRLRGLELLEQQLADERERHDEQVALVRERRAEERRAELVAQQDTIHGGDREDDHQIHLTNAGRVVAREIRLRVVNELGGDLTREFTVHDLAPDQAAELRVSIGRDHGRGQLRLLLHARWRDAAGDHDEQLTELRPLR